MMPAIGREHRPADAGHDGRHHERHQLDVGGVVAEEADALLGVAGGDQQLAVPAPVELPDDHQADDQQARGDQVEVLLDRRVVQVLTEEGGEGVQAVEPTGLLDRGDQQGREGDRHGLGEDGEVGALHPALQDGVAEDERHDRRQGDDGEQREGPAAERLPPAGHRGVAVEHHEVGHVARAGGLELHVHGHGVAAEPEEHALAHDEHAAPAPGEADADRGEGPAAVLAEVAEPERGERAGRPHQQHQGQDADARAADRRSGAAWPGRTCSARRRTARPRRLASGVSDASAAVVVVMPAPWSGR